nr:AAA family ATPase [Mycoplasmopsis bovis]
MLSLVEKPNVDVYITGSNSKMLSTDVLTQFRDRGDEMFKSIVIWRSLKLTRK